MSAMRIRTHGDYHLEQVLSTGKDFVIIDFDGPEGDALPDRRRKHSAFRDVAGMIFSFQYAAASASLDPTIVRDVDRDAIAPWATAWHRWVSAAFLRAYLDAAPGAVFIPPADELPLLLEVHLIEQALHALREELDLGGETVAIPIAALTDLLAE
jgi:predicted trehalose synthase